MKIIGDILKKTNPNFAKLIYKSENSFKLNAILSIILGEKLSLYCNFANYNNSELTIAVTSSMWITRLRFIIPNIIKQLKTYPEFKDLNKIKYYMVSDVPLFSKIKNEKIRISSDNEKLWRKTMEDIKK